MKHKLKSQIKKLLIDKRRTIFELQIHLASEIEELRRHFSEPVDNAQHGEIEAFTVKLKERTKDEIKEIDLALSKIESGTYGICELCERTIPLKRLKALPAARLCHKCAKEYEITQRIRKHPCDEIIDDNLLFEYRQLIENMN